MTKKTVFDNFLQSAREVYNKSASGIAKCGGYYKVRRNTI